MLDERYDWAAVSHPDLYRAVHQRNDPGEVGQISAEWATLSGSVSEASRLVRDAVAAASYGWEGSVSDVAQQAMRDLADWTADLASAVTAVARQVEEQGRIMTEARTSMPEPVDFSYEDMTRPFVSGSIRELTSSTVDLRPLRDTSLSAHEQAVLVMLEMEEKSRELDRAVVEFRLPRNPFTGQDQEPVTPVALVRTPSGPDTAPLPVLRADTPGEPGSRVGTPHPAGPSGPPAVPPPAEPPVTAQHAPGGGRTFAPMSGDLGFSPHGFPTTTAVADVPQPQRTTPGPTHATTPPPATGMSTPMMPMSPSTGPSQPDSERKSRYVLAEDFFASPGDDLPPPVIGAEEEW